MSQGNAVLDEVEKRKGSQHRELSPCAKLTTRMMPKSSVTRALPECRSRSADAIDEHLAQDCRIEHRTSSPAPALPAERRPLSSVYGVNSPGDQLAAFHLGEI